MYLKVFTHPSISLNMFTIWLTGSICSCHYSVSTSFISWWELILSICWKSKETNLIQIITNGVITILNSLYFSSAAVYLIWLPILMKKYFTIQFLFTTPTRCVIQLHIFIFIFLKCDIFWLKIGIGLMDAWDEK